MVCLEVVKRHPLPLHHRSSSRLGHPPNSLSYRNVTQIDRYFDIFDLNLEIP